MDSHNLSCVEIDDTFGPYALYCRGYFDFTLLFEETILTVLPLGLLLFIVPLRITYLLRRQKKVVGSPLLHLKLTAFAALAILQLVLLVLGTSSTAIRTRASIPAYGLTFVSSIVFCILSYVEHARAVQPSLLLNAYFFSTLLFDTARARTLWMREDSDSGRTIAIGFTVSVALKFVLLLLEVTEKRWILQPPYNAYPPEATSGIFNRSFFVWLNSLFLAGFSKLLTVEELFTLDKHLVSEQIHERMQAAWTKVTAKGTHSLLVSTFKVLKWPVMSVVFPRLCLVGFKFSQPFLIEHAINFSMEPLTKWNANVGYGLIGAYIFVYVGIAVSMGQYQHLSYRTITMARGGLISMLYRKAIDLNVRDVDPASSMTLMSADIERIVHGWQTMHDIWANVIEVALAIYLLERQLGVACAIPIGVSVLSLFGSIIAMNFVMAHQKLWLEAMERRISATSAMLSSMKGIKMCGLKQTLFTNLQNLRVEELNISKKFRRLLIWNMGFSYISQVFSPILTFALYAILARKNGGAVLDFSRVFTSLSLFTLLAEPLQSLIMCLTAFLASVGCFARIQEFLDKATRTDPRRKPTDATNDSGISDDSIQALPDLSGLITEKPRTSTPTPSVSSQLSFSSKDAFKPKLGDQAIIVRDGCFGWNPDADPLLKSITLSIPRKRLTMLVGPVGCGKSTLLKTFLGEVPSMGGTVEVGSLNMAYCDQTPWHMNQTIRESIVAVADFDKKWYESVLRACALEEDLRQMSRGDQTVVGSKGVALSGGQSQRISLARAVYARKEIVVLDDVLSGIDAATENHIFHSLLGGKGLLRCLHSTVILSSSSPKRLPYADHILALDAKGQICEQGHFDELNSAGGYVCSFGLPPPDWLYKPDELSVSSSKSQINDVEPKSQGVAENEQDFEAEANRRTGDWAIYLYYIGSVGWPVTIIFAICITAFVFCISFPTVWVKWWASAEMETPYARMGFYLGIYAMLGVLAIAFLVASTWQMLITMVPKSGENFHKTLLGRVLSAPMSFFSKTDSGVTMNRFSQDLQLIDMELPLAALNTFAIFVLCLAQMAIIGAASKYAAISFPLVLAALYFIQNYYLRTSRQLRFMDIEAKAPLYSQFTECLTGLATIRAFGWQNALEEKNRRLLDRSQRPFYLLYAVQRWLTVVLDLVVAAIAVLLITLVVTLHGTVDAGFVGVALVNIIQFSQSIKFLVTYWTMLETHIGAIARIKLFNEAVEPEDKGTENCTPPTDWPADGGIEFNSVSAEYKSGEPVLKDLSFIVAPGEKVGICGRTGSGKSSVVLSLFRMIELTGGSISIDGMDISSIPRQEIRSRITGVAQDSFLLKGSLRLNVDPVGSLTDGAIINALRSVQLWSVVEEKGGLNADIDELHLSHGQKQFLCLARAILRPNSILVLDEATSNVDSKTDEIMQRVIREKLSRHTIIAVAHNLDTILDFDKVAVLGSGELVEYGDPYALLSSDSAFTRLYASTTDEQPDDMGVIRDEITVSSRELSSATR